MTKKLLLFFAMLCAFAQGVWAQANWEAVYAMTQTISEEWTAINAGSTTGHTLGYVGNTTYYYATSNLNFTNSNSGGSGLTIRGTVYLYVPEGVTLTCTGADADGMTGAGAGIELTSGNNLYLLGGGTVNATGGNAANGSNGDNGANANFVYDEYCQPGSGGNGGNGGGGAGAGIGTRGGNGGTGGAGATAITVENEGTNYGVSGIVGGAGGTAGSMGNLYVVTSFVNLFTTGGAAGTSGSGGARGYNAAEDPYNQYAASGGGGGGGGGFGGAASNIGTGGPGGGGGGGGAAGNSAWRANITNGFYRVGAGGGSGGKNGDGSSAPNGTTSELTNPYNAEYNHGLSGSYDDDGWQSGNGMCSGGSGGAKGGDAVAGTTNNILATDENGKYLINNANDWDVFAAQVTNGNTYSDKTLKLMADISVSTMAGASSDNSFQGTFDGQGHTLTFTKGTPSVLFNEEYCAPFRYVKGATIQNLKVDGSIYSSRKFAAGLVSCNGYSGEDGTSITNCHVSTVIYSSVNGDGTHGGFVANSEDGCLIKIEGCTYTGRLLTNNGTTSCGGFLGWMGNCDSYISNAMYAPSGSIPGGWAAITDGATFLRGGNSNPSITNCYYTETFGTAQGKQAYTITPGEYVTVVNAGDATEYNVSGITSYGTGIKYYDVLIAGSGENVSLTLGSSRPGYIAHFQASAGTLSNTGNPYTLTMPNSNVTISAISWIEELQLDDNGDYLIGSTDDWLSFCEMMKLGINNFSGKTVKLTADINVSTMAGPTTTNSFQGTFIGGDHTITATITDTINQGTAIFRYIKGATIKNLKVAGTITSNQPWAAALVGFSTDTGNSIKNCMVTANVSGSLYVGGIVGCAHSSIDITGCVFSGLMTGGSNRTGAFISYSIFGLWNVTDCLYIMPDGQNTSNLNLVQHAWGTPTISRCYKTTDAGSQGTTARNITGSTGVTVSNISPVGDSIATYSVSGITAYAKGISCGETFYYGNGDEVNLDLSCIATSPVEYYASAGTLTGSANPYKLTMPDSDVVIHVKALQDIGAAKWYVISTPMHDAGESFESVSQVENLTSDSYDLFRYSETEAKWENQKAGDGAMGFDNLAIGRGYIYRCSDDRTLTFNGELNSAETYSVTLTATDAAGELKGFNLIGNPYPFRVHLNRDYYTLNPDGTTSEHFLPHNDSLEVGQGALVYTATGEILTFYASTRSTNAGTKGLPPLPKGFFSNENDNENGVAQESNRPFAYISGDQLIIEGTGILQVYDVIGRLLFRENVSTYQQINKSKFPQTGVYILLLNGQSQKIIIR